MNDCLKSPIVYLAAFFLILAFVFTRESAKQDDESFIIGSSYIRNAAPYYTTTFQAYPGKYMNYSSDRNSYCMQQHQQYSGYRNCMLYLE